MKKIFVIIFSLVPGFVFAQKVALTTHSIRMHYTQIVNDSITTVADGNVNFYPDGQIIWEQNGKGLKYTFSIKSRKGDWDDIKEPGKAEFQIEKEGKQDQLFVERTESGIKIMVYRKTRYGEESTFQLIVDKVTVL